MPTLGQADAQPDAGPDSSPDAPPMPNPMSGPVSGKTSRRNAAIFLACTQISFLAASSAPTPLYRLYQERWSFSPALLTVIFGVYAFTLLSSLLTVGSLSDHVGRRPVIFASLLLQAAAMLVFMKADGTGALIAARVIQGFSTGAATSAVGAALLDFDHDRGPLINSLAPGLGMAAGALGASALAQYAPWPMQLVYAILFASFLLQAALLWRLPETIRARSGALQSLRPRISVPAQARTALLAVTPINIAVWALGGLYLSLVPSIIRAALGAASPLIGGLTVATLTLSGAGAILAFQRLAAARILWLGTIIMVLGVASVLAAVHWHLPVLLFAGTVIAGFGWGGTFLGELRTILPLARPTERAGLMSAFYVQSYLAMSVPAMLAGVLARSLGLVAATEIYGIALIVLALGALLGNLAARSP